MSAAPDDRRWRISIKREPGAGASEFLHEGVGAGDVLQLGAPRGRFVLPNDELPIVFIGAGIGVTPLLSMLGCLAHSNDTRGVWWIHSTRSAVEIPHASETARLLERLGARTHVRRTRPSPAEPASPIPTVEGRLSPAELPALGVPKSAHFMICGPELFMSEMIAGLLGWGVAPEHIHQESFGSAASGAAGRPVHPPIGTPGSGPEVSFTRSALTVSWDPQRYGSLLELAEACDVPVNWSCRTGACHLCESSLVSGRVTYSPQPLEAPTDGNALLCCSTPEGELVLDL